MKKVYVFLADGFEEIEGLTAVDILRRAEIETVMVSVMGREAVEGAHGIKVTADGLYDAVEAASNNFADADMLVLPGGGKGFPQVSCLCGDHAHQYQSGAPPSADARSAAPLPWRFPCRSAHGSGSWQAPTD